MTQFRDKARALFNPTERATGARHHEDISRVYARAVCGNVCPFASEKKKRKRGTERGIEKEQVRAD